jgi:hypothetical protein
MILFADKRVQFSAIPFLGLNGMPILSGFPIGSWLALRWMALGGDCARSRSVRFGKI